MSTVDSSTISPVIPEVRPHSPDIIDVDALDADDIVYIGSARPSQRRRVGEDGRAVPVTTQVIHVTDSEDDDEIQFIGHNPGRPQPPPVRRERIFSPPPPPQIGGIPPVPLIPHRFMPFRQRPPPGLIVPVEDPLPFEVDLHPPPPAEQSLPVAAAPSHYVPSMGLGGALLAGVRRIMTRNPSRRPERRNSWGVSGAFIMRWDPFDFAGREDELLDGLDEIGFLGEDINPMANARVRSQIERAFKQRGREVEPDYKPDYTHSNSPLPGFTHDFLPPSSPSPIAEEADTPAHRASGSDTRLRDATLVCAACDDPLVLGASDVGEDRAQRKLWGLRCGHLLDGKCIEKLMQPTSPTCDVIGSSGRKTTTELAENPPTSGQDVVADCDAGSMRSRLRPRRGMAGPSPSASYVASVTPLTGRRAAPRPQTSHRSNRKGKGKMKAPVVEAEHEWNCPVSGCGHAHVSLLIDGRWTMDERRGAITAFV